MSFAAGAQGPCEGRTKNHGRDACATEGMRKTIIPRRSEASPKGNNPDQTRIADTSGLLWGVA
jgi:hypothetical protein